MSDQQLKSFLRRVLKGFSARNYRVTPRLWQPDFGWDHAGVPLAFPMALTTGSSGEVLGRPGRRLSVGAVLVFRCFAIYVTRD